jgi:hypothetical protein
VPSGSYLSVVLDAGTFRVLDSGLSPGPAGLARQPRTSHVPARSPPGVTVLSIT